MSSPKLTKRRNNSAMCRGSTGTRVSVPSACFSDTVQPLFSTSQATYAPTTSGSDSSMAFPDGRSGPLRGYGLGTGSATTDGCERSSDLDGDSGTYGAWRAAGFSTISAAKAALTNVWIAGTLR